MANDLDYDYFVDEYDNVIRYEKPHDFIKPTSIIKSISITKKNNNLWIESEIDHLDYILDIKSKKENENEIIHSEEKPVFNYGIFLSLFNFLINFLNKFFF